MLFNSLVFWLFLPIFLAFYFSTKGKLRLWVCLIGSYIFYGWWDVRFLLLIAFLTIFNYLCGLKIHSSGGKNAKRYVNVSVILSLLTLGFFKYFNFFIDSFNGLSTALGFQFHYSTMSIILPVGISFYTFQTMSYTIDLYRKKVEVEKSLLKFSVFVAFFPQLVAGPVVRACDFLPQLQADRKVRINDIILGVHWVLWGFILKSVMADNLALTVDQAFQNYEAASAFYLALAVVFYAFQIYGDFAGYSLIAIGVARVMGFRFCKNFDRPYFSSSFSEFWQRWHISLSSWLRDYLYIPLGGNRGGIGRTQVNLMLTMLLGGLWHGAAWTFVIWGGLHGLYLILQRWTTVLVNQLKIPQGFVKFSGWLIVMFCVCLSWIYFRANDLDQANVIIMKIFNEFSLDLSSIEKKFFFVKGGLILFIVFLIEFFSFRFDFNKAFIRHKCLSFIYIPLCLLILSLLGMYDGGAFIYFQF